MGRGTGEKTSLGRRRVPPPPRHGQLGEAEQTLLDALLTGELPDWPLTQLNAVVEGAFTASDIEQEWRHWCQHLLGAVRLRVDQGDVAKARELCDNYWPKLLGYRESARGGSVTEKDLWQAAKEGQLSADQLLAERRAIAMTLVTLDKEQALRLARQQPLQELVEAVSAGDLERAAAVFAEIDRSRSIDEDAFAWALETYKLFDA